MKAFLTKYALTRGITKIEGEEFNGFIDTGTRTLGYVSKSDYKLTLTEAKQKAEDMRLRKIKSLENQLKKYRAMKFI